MQAAIAAAGGGGGSGPSVWMKRPSAEYPLRYRDDVSRPSMYRKTLTNTPGERIPADLAELEPHNWTDQQRRAFWNRLVVKGIVDANDPYTFEKLIKQWGRLVGHAANHSVATGKPFTPWDAIGLVAGSGDGTAKPKPYKQTVTSRSVNLTQPEVARALLTRMMAQWLGRDPRANEVDDFHEALNSAQEDNPNLTRTTTSYGYDKGGNFGPLSTSAVTTGGVDPEAFSQRFTESERFSKEHAYVQAATTYYNALVDAISAPF